MARSLLLFLLFFFCVPLQEAAAQSLRVDQLRFGQHPGKVRTVIELSELADFRVFALQDPYRLVIDLPRFQWNAQAGSNLAGYGVRHVRQGDLNTNVSRIVLEMANPVVVHSAFMLPAASGRPDRLVVDYSTASVGEFQQHKGTIHGNLDVDQPVAHAQTGSESSERYAAVTPAYKPRRIYKPLIVLDPGHGGKDPGAIGPGSLYEKNIVLALGKELKKELEDSGKYRVKMTRDRDIYIRLYDRVKIARNAGADLFVSLHADSVDKPHVRGASIYTLSETASDAQSAKLAARENRSDIIAGVDLSVEDDDVANILVDLAMRDTMNQSKFFANTVVDKLDRHNVRILDRTHRSAGFAVLKAPDVPSILVEAGFMSNRKEAAMLSRPDYRRKVVKAIEDAIDAYFRYVESNADN